MKTICIMQPYIFPYIGYFQLFEVCDVFVIYDDVQYMKGGWINRNKILYHGSPKYITFPVKKVPLETTINKCFFHDNIKKKKNKILSTLHQVYSKAPFFQSVYPLINDIIKINENNVARFAENSLKSILDYLGINVEIRRSIDLKFNKTLKGQDRVIAIVKKVGGDCYINPIGGQDLYSSAEFAASNIDLRFLNCKAEPYKQFSNEFVANLSIIDVLMFNSIEKIQFMLKQFQLVEKINIIQDTSPPEILAGRFNKTAEGSLCGSIFLENEESKSEQFRTNDKLNALLSELKELLSPVQRTIDCPLQPQWPVGCIIGNPRSGSTLLLQFMASTGVFSYPTNVLTRFSYAPYIGGLIQKMLFDPKYDFHGDFADIQSQINFESDIGKSKGALATNEFQHFFRNYMPNFDIEWLDDNALKKVDCKGMMKGLASIEKAFERPFITKANILQHNLEYFAREIACLLYFHIRRKPIFIMQSIFNSRKRYYGSQNVWWSVKPREYNNQLKDMDVYHQIAGQVYFTDMEIEKGLMHISDKNQLTIEYESFCENPEAVYEKIIEKYSVLGCELNSEYNGPKSFVCSNKIRLPEKDIESLQSAFEDFASGNITFN